MALVYLAQSDTTIGLLSKDSEKLNALKGRPKNQSVLIESADFSILKSLVRVPNAFKSLIRRSAKTTFIYPNSKAVRVVRGRHGDFLKRFKTLYSTSANLTQCTYDKEIAFSLADAIVSDERGLFESASSKIFRLYKHKKVRVR
ncbi:Sua5 YciO YrdC YwlC family protein [Helicobacter pylori]|uniref:Sua5 YciO YrdC YwlC family protein n=1 Tax=Helicobacter pylori TaxID=210 RepID=UPI001933517D|nr:Sua5 YciO YrdC YwlC family protein [Helicobacter pylori]MBM0611328.1 Sua5 YciO YrdC YwlC family protein [Helicobacter pylori]MBM0627497.1 Sua5 YciO YrdC YwlC family protein [Helicobacter pylori]